MNSLNGLEPAFLSGGDNIKATGPVDTPILSVHDICVHYKSRAALTGVSMSIAKGEIFGVLGPNGAGKSTLIKAITSRMPVNTGEITIAGEKAGSRAARRAVGVAPQRPALYDRLTPMENLTVFGRMAGVPKDQLLSRARALLKITGGDAFADRECGCLSGGMRQRINIAAALMHGPALLILDEPAASLDVKGVAELNKLILEIANDGVAVLIVTHDMGQAVSICHRIGVFADGRLSACDTPIGLIEKYSGDNIEIIADASGKTFCCVQREAMTHMGFECAKNGYWRREAKDLGETAKIVQQLQDLEKIGAAPIESLEINRPGLGAVVDRLAEERAQ